MEFTINEEFNVFITRLPTNGHKFFKERKSNNDVMD